MSSIQRERLQGESEDWASADLLATIGSEVIPRLMLAHQIAHPGAPYPAQSRLPPTQEDAAQLARIAVRRDLPGALRFIEALRQEGLFPESVLLDLIAPTARLLGEQWEDEGRTFEEVEAGLAFLMNLIPMCEQDGRGDPGATPTAIFTC